MLMTARLTLMMAANWNRPAGSCLAASAPAATTPTGPEMLSETPAKLVAICCSPASAALHQPAAHWRRLLPRCLSDVSETGESSMQANWMQLQRVVEHLPRL